MPITVHFLDSNPHILYYCFLGRITAADLDQLADDEAAHLDQLVQDDPVSALLDWSALETIPAQAFPQLQDLRLIHDERIDWIVVVGANAYLRALAISLGMLNARRRFTFRAMRDEALALLGVTPEDDSQVCRS